MKTVNAIITIAFRDLIKLLRDKTRMTFGLVFPAIFIGVLGTSLQANVGVVLGYNFLEFVFIGVIAQTLFQSTAGGLISLVEDRQNDFAQEMFISPISRYAILAGKILGETMVSLIQIFGVLLLGFIIGVPIDWLSLLKVFPFVFLVALFGGSFGVLVMSVMSDQKTANQIFPFLLLPQFFLAGVFNPIRNLPLPILVTSRLAPMTYAVDLVRNVYYFSRQEYSKTVLFPFWVDMIVVVCVGLLFLSIGTFLFVRNERNK